ncbi:MAG: glycosyltransferase [Proteobacteria bacterium]|nr:glycosyltransferase [Pseudomonadota bacterium]
MTRHAVVTTVHPHGMGLAVGSHHLARELARRGWQVLLLADPASLAHALASLASAAPRDRMRAALTGWRTIGPSLSTWTPITLAPLAGRLGAGSPAMLDLWSRMSLPPLAGRLRRQGFGSPDLLVLDGAVQAGLAEALAPRHLVVRMFDHPDGRAGLPEALRQREKALIARADLVAVTAPGLAPVAAAAGARRVHLFENGVDPAAFDGPLPEPADLAVIPRPRVVYAGAIEPWVDQSLVEATARLCPAISFVWIGPQRSPPLGPDAPNVFRLGKKRYEDLPAYLTHCDAGLIPFDRAGYAALVDTVNPLKLYDYAAAGLPVVATPWPELERIGGPVTLAEGAPAFAAALRAVVAAAAPAAAREFARNASWQRRVDGLLDALGLLD